MGRKGRSGGRGPSHRRWEDLGHDLLVTIFEKVGVADLIDGVPFVCSSWRDAARDRHCWENIDFSDWTSISRQLGCRREDAVDFADLIDFAIDRSGEFVDSIIFPHFANEEDLVYVANRCPELLYFSLENEMPKKEFCEAISKFVYLEGMAVNECLLSPEVFLHVHDCCIYFSKLKLFADSLMKEEASIICDCLPSIRKLEVPNCTISWVAIVALLDGLKELEYLDISGYHNFGVTAMILKKASRLKVFKHYENEEGEFDICAECGQDWCYEPCECNYESVLKLKAAKGPATPPATQL